MHTSYLKYRLDTYNTNITVHMHKNKNYFYPCIIFNDFNRKRKKETKQKKRQKKNEKKKRRILKVI